LSRTLHVSTAAELQAALLWPILIAEFEFDSGALRVWSGSGNLSWDSKTWTGVGTFGGVSPVEEGADIAARGVRFSLSGIPSEYLSLALGDDCRQRPCSLWLALRDSAGAIIGTPYKLFSGRMEPLSGEEGPAGATLTIPAESRLVELKRARVSRYTHEEQVRRFSGDLGLAYIATMAEKPIYWGGPAPAMVVTPQPPREGGTVPPGAGDNWNEP